jgi:hypothetical protein
MEKVCDGLLDGFIARMGECPAHSWESRVRDQLKDSIATVVKEGILEDREVLSKLGLGEEPVPVWRVRLFLPDPAITEQLVRKLGGALPWIAEVTLEIADADLSILITTSGVATPYELGYGVGHLPVRWAVVGKRSLLLEFGSPPGLDEGIRIERIFKPNRWEVQEQWVYLFK